ncbi:MAG: TetR/AcrR family transcriptional regulator [Clostridia bacterium]|nr:TetR/AcrR family transcriptional regulator [Clostridia bacterium]
MVKLTREQQTELNRKTVLYNTAKLFLKKGYSLTTIKEIATASELSVGSLTNLYSCKEDIMSALVKYVLEAQFAKTEALLRDIPHDKIQMYASETTLQLYMAESSEHIRELYSVAYSLPHTTGIIQETITKKLEEIFKEHLADLETKDFYMLEIASGGIMRGFMTIPCNMWFSMEEKIKSFLTTTFRVYELPKEKIEDAIKFVSQFDFEKIAKDLIENLLEEIKERV